MNGENYQGVSLEELYLPGAGLEATPGRALETADLALLQSTSLGAKPPALKRIRAIHHQAARLMASGLKAVEVSAVLGFSQSRLSILKADPAFRELMDFYAEREDARFADVQESLKTLGLDAVQVLQQRLEEDPDDVSTKGLVEILTSALDRSGHGPISKREERSLSVTLTGEELAELKAAAQQKGRVYDQAQEESLSESEQPALGRTESGSGLPAEAAAGLTLEGLGI